MPGMMLNQYGSTHERVPGRTRDPVWTMDGATNEAHPGFLGGEEDTTVSFRGIPETIGRKGVLRPLHADPAVRCRRTPDAGGKVQGDNPT